MREATGEFEFDLSDPVAEVVIDLRDAYLVAPTDQVAAQHLALLMRAAHPARSPRRRYLVMSGMTAAFAATGGLAVAGALPAPAQRAVAALVHPIGIDLPSPAAGPIGAGTGDPSGPAPGRGGVNPGASEEAPGRQDNPGTSGEAPGHGGQNPSVTAPGQLAGNPSVTAPGQLKDDPSVTAPGQVKNDPSATAPGQSGERGSPSTGASGGGAGSGSGSGSGSGGGSGSGSGSGSAKSGGGGGKPAK